MKKLLSLIAVCFAVSMGMSAVAHAADTPTVSPAKSAQQTKMKTCNADAKGKKGDERKAFMKECLSADAPVAAAPAQQTKMKTCNVDAAGKKGDERKAFMKECLSADAPVAAAPAQQTKMKTCNVDAAGKKGDERKAFMKECLSK